MWAWPISIWHYRAAAANEPLFNPLPSSLTKNSRKSKNAKGFPPFEGPSVSHVAVVVVVVGGGHRKRMMQKKAAGSKHSTQTNTRAILDARGGRQKGTEEKIEKKRNP